MHVIKQFMICATFKTRVDSNLSWVTIMSKVVKTVRSDGTPSKAIPPPLNVHVYFAKACRCRVAIPQAPKLAKTVASDGAPSKQPSSFRHVTSLDGRTYVKQSINDDPKYIVQFCSSSQKTRITCRKSMRIFTYSLNLHFWSFFTSTWILPTLEGYT